MLELGSLIICLGSRFLSCCAQLTEKFKEQPHMGGELKSFQPWRRTCGSASFRPTNGPQPVRQTQGHFDRSTLPSFGSLLHGTEYLLILLGRYHIPVFASLDVHQSLADACQQGRCAVGWYLSHRFHQVSTNMKPTYQTGARMYYVSPKDYIV